MGVDPKEPIHPSDDWGDIPDPLLGNIAPKKGAPPAPAEPSATRGEVRRRRAIALAAFVVWPATILAFIGGGQGGRELWFIIAQTVGWAALLVLAGWTSLSRGPLGLGMRVRLSQLVAMGAPAVFLLTALMWPSPDASHAFEIGPFQYVGGCLARGLLVAAPVLALSAWSLRYSFPSGAAWRGAALGAASGLGGAVVLFFHCGSPFGGHIALGHGMPVVIATLLGAFLGAKLDRA